MAQIKRKLVEEYQKLGMTLETAAVEAMKNLGKLDQKKSYTIQHDSNREGCIDLPIAVHGTERYTVSDIDAVDIVNFALWMYLPIARQNRFKTLLKERLDERVFFSMLDQLGIEVEDQETDRGKERVYVYTNCPVCGTRRYYFSWDQVQQNIFAGFYNPSCDMHQAMDIITFVQKRDRMGYKEAVATLYAMLQKAMSEPTVNETSTSLEYCNIKAGAKYCIVATDKTDLLSACQFMQDESVVLVEPHQLSNLKY